MSGLSFGANQAKAKLYHDEAENVVCDCRCGLTYTVSLNALSLVQKQRYEALKRYVVKVLNEIDDDHYGCTQAQVALAVIATGEFPS